MSFVVVTNMNPPNASVTLITFCFSHLFSDSAMPCVFSFAI